MRARLHVYAYTRTRAHAYTYTRLHARTSATHTRMRFYTYERRRVGHRPKISGLVVRPGSGWGRGRIEGVVRRFGRWQPLRKRRARRRMLGDWCLAARGAGPWVASLDGLR